MGDAGPATGRRRSAKRQSWPPRRPRYNGGRQLARPRGEGAPTPLREGLLKFAAQVPPRWTEASPVCAHHRNVTNASHSGDTYGALDTAEETLAKRMAKFSREAEGGHFCGSGRGLRKRVTPGVAGTTATTARRHSSRGTHWGGAFPRAGDEGRRGRVAFRTCALTRRPTQALEDRAGDTGGCSKSNGGVSTQRRFPSESHARVVSTRNRLTISDPWGPSRVPVSQR